ncbi:TniB protein [Devosia crocina]|uniref:TniB protein n=1 Tax=Devosia crocina TaxID=429728 RepID=A0A1I7NAT0_9HYPH|nr:TniB family NTP-binding protein [Devosia crocina]SFV31731.1 TniB protein [Devosia crocina]
MTTLLSTLGNGPIDKVGRAFIQLSTSERIIDCLQTALRLHGTGHFGKIHAILGTSHVGKSTAIDFWMKQTAKAYGGVTENLSRDESRIEAAANVSYVTLHDRGQRIHPVVRIQIVGNPTFKALGDDTLRGLVRGRAPVWKNGGDLASLLATHLTAFQTKVVIYEDIQELAKVKGARKNEAVVLLRNLCKVVRVEVVVVGTEGTLEVLQSENETRKLVATNVTIRPFSRPDFKNEKPGEFVTFLTKLRTQLPNPKLSPIDEEKLADMLWRYSKGVIGDIKHLMLAATDTALQSGISGIDRTALRKHLELKKSLFGKANPFYLPGDE